ncbi:glutaminyl-peptide cyclotransferase [Deinococcus radiodurans]|jgi:Glutamine cyclotransferase|uniref:Glutamine cyclotransferase n=1 Tax=Deinococcus radiodurans (strain ATCC 13939 / DSM 20539 / JCM 16871 / CCUG 27074 / LMG 4051 / NBRC 15346 / NCIMB 9279 / VKM B-1422 / R1) TaxID=243230 RepID=Q9RY39_DEIRA|nr:glutaminyl-peptide cyclotransferase [Deinococcus radiodurans]AAF09704.1 glutamine cyclotransferase [Deinococcus radiodurans R1 = ATCC 13939 = DSM 20539]ANC72600.1 glutamine cyclotransferase [Deinococcus radiodurans R1 = ATCC 13939 = DSM 20539]QEM72085.1 glutaminyl-peptide cyclotransferase [Deinococcus radiodurans]QIP28357.1 glutaminyl-peptide cyclotransferase [Deinococcus radiodurans]QIP30770.1 glutaminyl-peptide cyclotransferase [Deinococcus radiodurans]
MRRSPALSLSTFALLALAALPLALSSAPTPTRAPAAKVSSARTPVLRPVVAARYPHDRAAFTQGLQYLGGGHYLESTGQVGESDLRVSELRGAKVLWSTPLAQALPQAFGEGSTQLGSTVYQLTWQDGVALTYDARTFKETGRHRYQGEGWGLTSDGKSLIMSNGTSTLVWRDPKTFAAQRSVQVTDQGQPVRNLNELEYVQGSVYANVWLTDRIARIHPQTGKVLTWIDVSDLTREVSAAATKQGQALTFDDVPNGIAFIPERGTLLLTGKRWPTLFEVKVPGLGLKVEGAKN